MLPFSLDTGPQSFMQLIFCPVDDTLFEVNQDFHCFTCVKLQLMLN